MATTTRDTQAGKSSPGMSLLWAILALVQAATIVVLALRPEPVREPDGNGWSLVLAAIRDEVSAVRGAVERLPTRLRTNAAPSTAREDGSARGRDADSSAEPTALVLPGGDPVLARLDAIVAALGELGAGLQPPTEGGSRVPLGEARATSIAASIEQLRSDATAARGRILGMSAAQVLGEFGPPDFTITRDSSATVSWRYQDAGQGGLTFFLELLDGWVMNCGTYGR